MKGNVSVKKKKKGSPFSHWSIGTKLITVFLVLVIVPLSFTAYYNLTNAEDEINKVAEETLRCEK